MGLNTYRKILYLLIIILIALGIALFLGRTQLLEYLRQQSNIDQLVNEKVLVTPGAKEALDTDILKSAKFKILKNNVLKFDFNNICYRPDTKTSGSASVATLETASSTATSTATTTPLDCSLGNNNLFFIKNN